MTENQVPDSHHTDSIRDAIEEGFQLAVLSHQTGRTADAEALYRAALQLQADHPEAHHGLGELLMQQGQPEAALPHLVSACQLAPQAGQHWLSVAECLMKLLRADEAVHVLETAIEAGLEDAHAQALLLQAREAVGARQEEPATAPPEADREFIDNAIQAAQNAADLLAETQALAKLSVQRAAIRRPRRSDLVPPAQLLAPLIAKDWPVLASTARQILARNPLHAKAWDFLGVAYLQLGKNEAARIALLRASELLPKDAEVWDQLGITQRQASDYPAAERSFQRSLSLAPQRPETWMNLANLQTDQQNFEAAIQSFRHALDLQPDSAIAHSNMGRALRYAEDIEAAAHCFQRAVELEPELAEAHTNLGNALRDLGRFEDALLSYERARALKPGLETIYTNLATAQTQVGLVAEAIANCKHALALNPDSFPAYGMLLFHLSHHETEPPEAVFAAHRAFGERAEHTLRAQWPMHPNVRAPNRTLRVGFVSADLRNHAIASFIEPIWAALDPSQIEIWVYSNHNKEDSFTEHLKTFARQWKKVVDLSDQALARLIFDDRIDILIDLSGHTSGSRLQTFARKPAPIQVSWMGYPNTTGLTSMDYFLADRFLAPKGYLDAFFTEKIVRLPASAVFRISELAPPVNVLPAFQSGTFTFGSFNRAGKLGHEVVSLWSRVLHAVPQSRLLIGGLSEHEVNSRLKENLIARFSECGISTDRLVFHPRKAMAAYLALHHQVDMILDTFPYSGGTTTCHAASMGVPVLTLTGRTMPSLQGATVNAHLGLEAFIAESPEAFVAAATYWTQHLPELATIRSELRARLLSSSFGHPEIIVRGLQSALRAIWQRWCAGQSPENFEVEP